MRSLATCLVNSEEVAYLPMAPFFASRPHRSVSRFVISGSCECLVDVDGRLKLVLVDLFVHCRDLPAIGEVQSVLRTQLFESTEGGFLEKEMSEALLCRHFEAEASVKLLLRIPEDMPVQRVI